MIQLFSEAIKLEDGIFHNFKYHQMRVNHTLAQFYRTHIDLTQLKEMIREEHKHGLYKCRIVYGKQIESVEFIPYQFRQIKSVAIVKDNQINYDYKYTNRHRLNQLLQQSGCDDIIIIKNNMVTDSSSANLVFHSASGLYTPSTCLLRGTQRQLLLDKGIIQEQMIRVEDIQHYSRISFINAIIDLKDNLSIDVNQLSLAP